MKLNQKEKQFYVMLLQVFHNLAPNTTFQFKDLISNQITSPRLARKFREDIISGNVKNVIKIREDPNGVNIYLKS